MVGSHRPRRPMAASAGSIVLLIALPSLTFLRSAAEVVPSFLQDHGISGVEGHLGDVAQTCDVDSVQVANVRQLHPILHDLVNTTFFRLFRVNLKSPACPFWQAEKKESSSDGTTCEGGGGDGFAFGFGQQQEMSSSTEPPKKACDLDSEEESSGSSSSGMFSFNPTVTTDEALDMSMTEQEQQASIERDTKSEDCEFEEDLPTYFVDMCAGDSTKGGDLEDVNLIKNPERNTGYNGSHIWEAMYSENCFEVGSPLPRGRFGVGGMCYEERVLYRLLSGWHASTTISIVKNFYAPGTKSKTGWAPNPGRFMETLGKYPERIKNLHFSFVVILRAVKRSAPLLQSYAYSTGDTDEDAITKSLMNRLLDSQVLSVCSPLFEAFDESRLFSSIETSEQRSQLKRQFKSVFQNITVLVDCVQCTKCRLHAKVFSLGLGTALKILLTPHDLLVSTISRDEVVALVNVLWKLSETMEDARELTRLYWQQYGGSAPKPPSGSVVSDPVVAPKDSQSHKLGSGVAPPQKVGPAAAQAALPNQQIGMADFTADERRGLLDLAFGAVKRAGDARFEENALRSLVAGPPSDQLLLLAKHYASDRPDMFTRVAAAANSPTSPTAEVNVASTYPAISPPPDAIIIGGGLAGMVAAVSMLDRGASITLVDKQPYLGGNSGKASSGINAAIETSVESLVKDTTKSAGKLARSNLIDKLANDSTHAVSWLRDRTGVDLSMRSQLGGHSVQRTLRPSNAFVGAELTFAIGQLLNKVAAEHPDKCKLLLKSKWTGLSKNDNEWHVTVASNGTDVVLKSPSVVISSGGFGHDVTEVESFMKKERPDLLDFPTTLGPQTTGDGLRIARDLGAKLVDMDRVQLHPTGFVDPNKPLERTKTLAAELLRGVGGLLLDHNGSRFTDELGTRQAVVDAELRTAKVFADDRRVFSLVLNSKAAANADRHVTLYSKKGLLTKVQGLDGLAAHLGVSTQRLNQTFDTYNSAAALGKDSFGRTVFPAHWPISSDEDFFVGKVVPVIHYTMGGIAIDTDGRVLSKVTEEPIPGLYAIGEASGGVHGDNRLAGNSLLECTVFGRHVGTTLPIVDKSTPAAGEIVPATEAASPEIPATESTSNAGGLKEISSEEMKEHGSKAERKYIALYGNVYDLTDYVDEHPGGAEAITDVAGGDATETFETVHNRELLESMGFEPIGTFSQTT